MTPDPSPPDFLLPPRHSLLRHRRLLLILYIILVALWIYGILFAHFLHDLDPDSNDVGWFTITPVVFLLMPLLFLRGAPHWNWPRATKSKSIYLSLASGAMMAGLLTLGLLGAIASLINLANTHVFDDTNFSLPGPYWFQWTTVIGIPWLCWLLVFTFIFAGQWHRKFFRIYRLLIAGTVLELLITIPIDAQVRKRTSCYCGEGSFFALVIGLTMILWTFGPGIALLYLTRKIQRERRRELCPECGYDLRASKEKCPECGTAISLH